MQKVGIIGLGLIGGSILKGLSQLDYELYVVSKSSYQDAKSFTFHSSNLIEDISECDIVFVCCEMSKAKGVLKRLQNIVKKDTIVCDVCSLKGFLEDNYSFNYIGTHPMAGTENSGFEASFATLFEGAKWVITKKNETVEKIIKELGATPVLMDAKTHDKAVSMISHLPMLISCALFYSAKTNEEKILASSGFRDTTRLAMTNEILANDMLELNKENIENSLEEFISTLSHLKNMNADERIILLGKLAQNRAKMYNKNGKNTFHV